MKKIVKFGSILVAAVALFFIFQPITSHAASAPPLTSYKILGYSDPSIAGSDPNSFSYETKGSDYIVSGSTVYIVDEVYGYPTTRAATLDGASASFTVLHQYPIIGTYNGVPKTYLGYHDVYEFDNVSTGTHTFTLTAIPTSSAAPPWTPRSDSITLQVQN